MTARLAQSADAAQIRQLLEDYFADVARDFIRPALAHIRARIAESRVAAAIDPDAGTYCELKLEDGQHIEVELWLPRGPALNRLVPVLATAMREMKAQHPTVGGHRVSGVLSNALDDQGTPDKGQSIGTAMQAFLVDAQGQSVVRLDKERDGLVEPYATLDDLVMVFDRLGV